MTIRFASTLLGLIRGWKLSSSQNDFGLSAVERVSAKERNRSIDVAKGILILTVVVGHSGSFFSNYLYWFHMPAFFMISGFLFKKCERWNSARDYLVRKIQSYAILYLSYFVLLTLVRLLYTDASSFTLSKVLVKLFVGGRFVGMELGTFWFVTCLAISLIAFTMIQTFVRRRAYQLLILTGLYCLAHGEAYLQNKRGMAFYIPWNMDVALLAVCYVAIGFYSQQWLLRLMRDRRLRVIWLFASFATGALMIALDVRGAIHYRLDMNNVNYTHLAGDLFIPTVFALFILLGSTFIEEVPIAAVFRWFGCFSIVIMFLHPAVLCIYRHYFSYNWIAFSIVASVLPLVIGFVLHQSPVTRKLFIKG